MEHSYTSWHKPTGKALLLRVICNGTGELTRSLKVKQLCKSVKIPDSYWFIKGHCGQITVSGIKWHGWDLLCMRSHQCGVGAGWCIQYTKITLKGVREQSKLVFTREKERNFNFRMNTTDRLSLTKHLLIVSCQWITTVWQYEKTELSKCSKLQVLIFYINQTETICIRYLFSPSWIHKIIILRVEYTKNGCCLMELLLSVHNSKRYNLPCLFLLTH